MRMLLFGAFITQMILGLNAPYASPADSPGTVTRWEYRHVFPHDTRHHVHHIFDTSGKLVVEFYGEAGVGHQWRNYPYSQDGKTVEVMYRRPPHAQHWHLAHRCLTSTPSDPCFTR